GGLSLEARAVRRGEQSLRRPGLGARQRRQSLLVVLVGLVGKAADQRETAKFDSAACQRAARARAEDQRAEPAERRTRAHLVVGDQLLDLRHQFLRRAAGHLTDGVARTAGRTGRLVETAGAFAYARGSLAEHLTEDVCDAARLRCLRLQLAQDIAQATAAL